MFESEHFKKEAGLAMFTPSMSEWVEKTNAVGFAGFTEFGRNPMGFVSKYSGIQELVYMRLEL